MEKLEPDILRSRLRFDFQTVMLMSNPMMIVEAYRNLDDLLDQRNMISSDTDAHLAVHYRVEYNIKTLVGPGRYSDRTRVRFDLFANIDYPYEEPACFVIESETEVPWSPHFLQGYHVCIGPIWERAEGKMLLGELMVHIAKLLNFDEPDYEQPNYGGWQPDAIEYWENELGRQPISRLIYPRLPDKIVTPATNSELVKTSFVKKRIIGSTTPAIKLRTTTTPLIKIRAN